MTDDRPAPLTCSWCGAISDPGADGPPATWTAQSGPRGVEYLCERCTRDNLRNIEGSLPTEWW